MIMNANTPDQVVENSKNATHKEVNTKALPLSSVERRRIAEIEATSVRRMMSRPSKKTEPKEILDGTPLNILVPENSANSADNSVSSVDENRSKLSVYLPKLKEIIDQNKKLAKKISDEFEDNRHYALNIAIELIEYFKLSPNDLFPINKVEDNNAESKNVTSKGVGLPPKYKDLVTGATWNGHGKRPNWFKALSDEDQIRALISKSNAG